MKLKEKTSEALSRIVANLLLWMAFAPVVSFSQLLFQSGPGVSTPPADIILVYVDRKLFSYQVLAAIALLVFFLVLKWRSRDEAEGKRAGYYAGLVRDEWGGVLINFGSLSFVAGWVASAFGLWIMMALCYLLGFFLIRKH